MTAQQKIEAAAKEAENDNLRIWNAVCKTDPRHTKKVNQRGGFTAISAHYQVMSATAEFGPVGIGWGYINGEPVWHENLVIVPVTIWHGTRENTFGPVYGGAEWKTGNRIDSDAAKKAATDGLTKGLSQLGFNADVFLGRFDDNKYVAELTKEFAANEEQQQAGSSSPSPPANPSTGEKPARERVTLAGPYTSITQLKTAAKEFVRTLESMGDLDEFVAWEGTDDFKAFCTQLERDMPDWWQGGPSVPAEFVPLEIRISQKKRDLEQVGELRAGDWRKNPINAG